jgi:hypothetical protein
MATLKATYAATGNSKTFDVPVTSLVDSIQTMQGDINKFLTQVMEEEKKQGITQPEIKEDDDAQDEDEDEEMDQETDVKEEETQALKKQKLEA